MSLTPRRLTLLFAISASLSAPAAHAGISFVDQYRTLYNQQTGDGNTLTQTGYVFNARLHASSADLYDSVTMSGGAGGPVSLPIDFAGSSVYSYGSPVYASQADMDTAFPLGSAYTYSATNGSGTDTTTLTPPATTDYPQSTPYLAGTTYSRLQGMDAGQSFQVDFSPFTTGGNAQDSFIFFTIYDLTAGGAVAYDASFLAPTVAGVTLAAGTLAAGHQYVYDFIFSNRDFVDTAGTDFAAVLGFDYRTQGVFSTAVPEPSSLALAAFGVAGGLLLDRRRRSRAATR